MAPAPKFSPQQQEAMILAAAARAIESSSLLDFTMAAVAREAGLSMGSVYKHVQSKEDVLIALATAVHKNLLQTFNRILTLPLRTPEKLIATLLFDYSKTSLYGFDCHLDMLVSNEAILRRASEGWVVRMSAAEAELETAIASCIKAAALSGELRIATAEYRQCPDLLHHAATTGVDFDTLAIDTCVHEITLGLWAMNVGFIHVLLQKQSFSTHQPNPVLPLPASAECAAIQNTRRFINAFDWQQALDQSSILRVCEVLCREGLR